MEINQTIYDQEIENIGRELLLSNEEYGIDDSEINERIDSHRWVIYTVYNLDVLRFSNNEEYGIENANQILKEDGLAKLHSVLAYWAMYADVQDWIQDWIEEHKDDDYEDDEDKPYFEHGCTVEVV